MISRTGEEREESGGVRVELTRSKFVRFLLGCHQSLNLVPNWLERDADTAKQEIRRSRSTKRLEEINVPALNADQQRG